MLEITYLRPEDPPVFEAAFKAIGWSKPAAQFERYLEQQDAGQRSCLVGRLQGEFVGYLTVVWMADYPPFRAQAIPELQDFNILPRFRNRGLGSALLDAAETLIGTRADLAGLGVGLYADYGPAQRLYVQRGYIPDGRGLAYGHVTVPPGETARVDDDLLIYFTKRLRKS